METSGRAKDAEVARLGKLLEATKASEADFAARCALPLPCWSSCRIRILAQMPLRPAVPVTGTVCAMCAHLFHLQACRSRGGSKEGGAGGGVCQTARAARECCLSSFSARCLSCACHRKLLAACSAHIDPPATSSTRLKTWLACTQLEASLRTKEGELTRLSKAVDKAEGGAHDASAELARAEEAAKKAEGEAAAAKAKASQLEASLKVWWRGGVHWCRYGAVHAADGLDVHRWPPQQLLLLSLSPVSPQ